jgi:transaldolase
VTTTRGEPLFEAVHALSREGVKVNMTAIFAPEQVGKAVDALAGGAPACVSVFAGRLADLGIDYRPVMQDAVARARQTLNVEIIWASTREVFNVVEADMMGCHIITAPADFSRSCRRSEPPPRSSCRWAPSRHSARIPWRPA